MDSFHHKYPSPYKEENERYFETQKIIRDDLQRILYLIEDYKDNEELVHELTRAKNNLYINENITFETDFEQSLTGQYLYFNYPDIDGGYINDECDYVYDYVTVVIKRNFKELYFIDTYDPSTGTIIKKFTLDNRTVNSKKYDVEYNSPLFKSSIDIPLSIYRLENLDRVAS